MKKYKLYRNSLRIRQGLNAKREIDLSQVKASIPEDVVQKQKNIDTAPQKPLSKLEKPILVLKDELRTLYTVMQEYSLANTIVKNTDSSTTGKIENFVAKFSRFLIRNEREKSGESLRITSMADSLKLVVE